jgi:WD40 repeat protein
VLVPECFSKDGSILAVKAIQKGDKTGEVLWDVHNWRPRRTLVRDEFCNFVALTPDNRTLVEATADSLSFFDSRTGRLRATFKVTFPTQADFNEGGDYIAGLDFTPDSRLAITGGTRSPCHIWDVKTGRLLHRSDNNLADHVALSPDGNTALLSGLYGITLYLMLWNVKTGRVIHRQNDTQTHYSPTYAMFSPDGKLIIAVMNHTTIDIRDSSNLRLIRTIRAFTNSNVYDLPCVVFSHDGHYLLVQWNDTVRVITVEGATLREVTLPGENIRSLIPASDGATVYISTDRSLWRWRFL